MSDDIAGMAPLAVEPQEHCPEDDIPQPIDAETLTRLLHELRNPLTVMMARTQMFTRAITQDRLHGAEECLEGLAVMEGAAQKIDVVLKAFQASAGVPPDTRGRDGVGVVRLASTGGAIGHCTRCIHLEPLPLSGTTTNEPHA